MHTSRWVYICGTVVAKNHQTVLLFLGTYWLCNALETNRFSFQISAFQRILSDIKLDLAPQWQRAVLKQSGRRWLHSQSHSEPWPRIPVTGIERLLYIMAWLCRHLFDVIEKFSLKPYISLDSLNVFTVTRKLRKFVDIGSLSCTVEKWNDVWRLWMETASIGQSFFLLSL